METIRVTSWKDVEKQIEEVVKGDWDSYFFRGHSDADWMLETTLSRTHGKPFHDISEYYSIIRRTKSSIETNTDKNWTLPSRDATEHWANSYDQFSRMLASGDSDLAFPYLVYLRHHGFPSPLLDWSASPYVAAYFATARPSRSEYSAIYIYKEREFLKIYDPNQAQIYILGPHITSHRRHYRQQSRYTISILFFENRWNFSPYPINPVHRGVKQDSFWKIEFPTQCRLSVLAMLDRFNVNAFTLFDTEDSLMETLAVREMELRGRK